MKKKKKPKQKSESNEVLVIDVGDQQAKMGRPRKPITEDQVYKLALIHCTANEIAAVLGCHKDTIYENFSDALYRGHEEGQMSLKRKMHEKALNGDSGMLIWLSKQRLGYKDCKMEEVKPMVFNVNINEIPK